MAAPTTAQSVQGALARHFGQSSPFVAALQLPAACDDNNLKILYARQADVLELLSVHAWLKELGLRVEDSLSGVVVAVQLLSGHIRLHRVSGSTPRLTAAGVLDAANSTLDLPDGSTLALGRIIDKMPEQVLKGVWLTAVKDAQQKPRNGGFELGSMQEVLTSIYRLNRSMRLHQHLACVSKLLSGQPMSIVARMLPPGVSSLSSATITAPLRSAVETLLMEQEASIRSHLQQALNVLYESPSEIMINQIQKMIHPQPAVVGTDQAVNEQGALPGVPVVAPLSTALASQQHKPVRAQQPTRSGPEVKVSRAYANGHGSALPSGRADSSGDARMGMRTDDRPRARRSPSPDLRRITKRARSRSRSPIGLVRRRIGHDDGLGRRPALEPLPVREPRRRSPSPHGPVPFHNARPDSMPLPQHVEAAVKLMIKMKPLPADMPVEHVYELLQIASLWEFFRNGGTHDAAVRLIDMRLPPQLLANGESEPAAIQRALRTVPNGPLSLDGDLRLHLCSDFARACKRHSYFKEQVLNAQRLATRWLQGRGEGVMTMEAFLDLFQPEAKLYMELFHSDRELVAHCFGIHFKARPHPTEERMLIVPAGQSPRASPTPRRREPSPVRPSRAPVSRRVSDSTAAAATPLDAPSSRRLGSTVAVHNLPAGLPMVKMQQLLSGFFGRYGELMPDGALAPRGVDEPGFVTFVSSSDAAELVRKSMDPERPLVVQGRRLEVTLATSVPPSKPHRPRAAAEAGGRAAGARQVERRLSADGAAGADGSREVRAGDVSLLGMFGNGAAAVEDMQTDGQGFAAAAERPASRDADGMGEQAARDQGPNTANPSGVPQVLHLNGNSAADAETASEELRALVKAEAGEHGERAANGRRQGDTDMADAEVAATGLLSVPSGDVGHGADRRPMLDQSLDDIARARKEQARSEAKMQQLRQQLPPHQRADSRRYPPTSPQRQQHVAADSRPSDQRPDPRNLAEDERKIQSSIFVCNLPYGCATVAGLQQIFMQFGDIEHIKVDSATSQGSWAVVTFKQMRDAKNLLRAYEAGEQVLSLHGREMHLKAYRPPPAKVFRSRGGMQQPPQQRGGMHFGRGMQY